MTIAIASRQRRESLLRLLRALDRQLATSAEARQELRIVVVLDGSTDGSLEAVQSASWSVPVDVEWQEHSGLAAARNAGLRRAGHGTVLFLDDDLVPASDLVLRHRRALQGHDGVVVGACLIPASAAAPSVARWFDDLHEWRLERPSLDQFDKFTSANASGAVATFEAVGGFDESFSDYGFEDYELGFRLLDRGVAIRYEPEAVVWHPDVAPLHERIARARSEGANAVRLVRRHPAARSRVFGERRLPRALCLIGRLHLRDPRVFWFIARSAAFWSRATAELHEPSERRMATLAWAAAFVAGVTTADPRGVLVDDLFRIPTARR
jgi:GT2 family glycosyltransferase